MVGCRPIDTFMDLMLNSFQDRGEPFIDPRRYRRLDENFNYFYSN